MENLDKIIENCNLTISQRTNYGYHFEFPPSKRFSIVCWSNKKGGYWYLSSKTKYYQRTMHQENHPIVKLSCEEILLPYPKTVIEKIKNKFHPHPFYKSSFEAGKI